MGLSRTKTESALAIKVSRFNLASPLLHVACAGALAALVLAVAIVITRSFARTLARNADTIQATEFAADASPNDSLTRYRYAVYLERSFDLTAIPRSLAEYENAVALSPHNFIFWLALGQARERAGDRPAAEAAYRRALELAPNYARTKWALGNNLVRQGQIEDGIQLIRGAVEQDPAFAGPAVIAVMQVFDGDVDRVSAVLGSNTNAAAHLVRYLVIEGRFDEALAAWDRIDNEAKLTTLRATGDTIRGKLIEAKRYRDAAKVSASLQADEGKRPMVGSISNGGFETGVETRDADPFDWQIGQRYPQFGLSDNQPKGGRFSLLVRFTTPTRLDLDTVSRKVAVEPGANYELSLSYRAEMDTRAEFRWEVVAAADGRRLGVSDPLEHSSGWTDLKVRFPVPADRDGITFRLIRENCNSAACTVSGNLWFDDFKLQRN